ncbi:MAG TPA: LysR substrate-binding domain-containing protein [Burkholderiales bacterium]|nr:LysR substrate-binding domain-containing protein [Burkholderiales bacterium]
MRIAQLRDFIATVEHGSLRAAARAIGVSQPAITKSIRQLENELHAQLLQRNARGASLTPAGKAFLARARVIQAELRKAEEDLQRLSGGRQGAVAFGVAPAACMLLVPEAMLAFRRDHAKARVRIVEGVNPALLPLVREETLDFSIGQGPAGRLDGALRFKPLFRPRLAIVGRRGHPLRAAKSLRELAGASWLMFYPTGSGATLERAFTTAGLALPEAIVQCESYAAALALLAKTDVLGLLIPQVTSDLLRPRHLQVIEIDEDMPAPLIGLYTRADAPLTPAAAALAQAVTAAGGACGRTDGPARTGVASPVGWSTTTRCCRTSGRPPGRRRSTSSPAG